jgi:hypothetical protein
MTTISHPKCSLVTQSVFVDEPVSGLRNIDSFGSILQVCAAPFSDLNRMMTTVSHQAYVTYLIDAAKVYTGHGNGNRNIGERLRPEEVKQAQVYVIYSLDPRYDKRVASYVEARLPVKLHCGSKSAIMTRLPMLANIQLKLKAVVVFETPPLWLNRLMILVIGKLTR